MLRPQEKLLQFDGLADFLDVLDWACGLASTRDRLAELSYGFSKRLADAGAGYTDVIVNPTHWAAWHGRLPAMIEAIDAGLTAAEQDGLPPVGLCVSLLRTQPPQAAAELLDGLVALRHPRVVALSSDGNEAAAGRTGPWFAEAFRRAGAAGLLRTCVLGSRVAPRACGMPTNCSVPIASITGYERSRTPGWFDCWSIDGYLWGSARLRI